MLQIKRLDHVSMAAANWRSQADRLQSLFGFKFLSSWDGLGADDFSGCVSQIPGADLEFEVITPNGPENFVQKFLNTAGPGPHHITIEVEDINAAASELERLGVDPFGGVQDDGEWYVTYVHPRDSRGVLYQLFVSHREEREVDRRTTGGGICDVKRARLVSIDSPDLDEQIKFQERVFGMDLEARSTDSTTGESLAVMRLPQSELRFEFVHGRLGLPEGSRPGIHHLALEVGSVERALEALRGSGVEPAQAGTGPAIPAWDVLPADAGGVRFRLFEE